MKPLPLLLALVLTGCSGPKSPTDIPRPEHDVSIFGEPLFVNGRRVTDDEIKLALIYGPGRTVLKQREIDLMIEDEIAHQSSDRAEAELAAQEHAEPFATPGARASARTAACSRIFAELHTKYSVTDAAFDEEYGFILDDFRQSYPTLDLGAEICRSFRSVDAYRDQLRRQLQFDRVFLPDDPDAWPPTTVEALRADSSGGDELIAEQKDSFRRRLDAAGGDTRKLPRGDPLEISFLREIVQGAMLNLITFKTQPDIIDRKLALWADTGSDGKPDLVVTIDSLWDEVEYTITETEIAEAKQWCITSIATRDRLAREGALLGEKERGRALAEYTLGISGPGGDFERDASRFHFPSVESYREYYCLLKSFERLLGSELSEGRNGELPRVLSEYLPRANQVMGLGMVDAQVLLVSAMDIPDFRWRKDGWSEAHRKAQRLRQEYDLNPTSETWARLMDENSEYWDPPRPEVRGDRSGGAYSTDAQFKRKGRFGPRYRFDLIDYVGESVFTEWVTGECITDHIFFDQAEGTIDGPFRGPLGWYLTRVDKRTPPSRSLDINGPRYREFLKYDYLRWAFSQYTKDAVARAKIRGWKPL